MVTYSQFAYVSSNTRTHKLKFFQRINFLDHRIQAFYHLHGQNKAQQQDAEHQRATGAPYRIK